MSSNDKNKEVFAKEFMEEEGLKGKAKRIKIIQIINRVGFDKRKIKVALQRSTIDERIKQE